MIYMMHVNIQRYHMTTIVLQMYTESDVVELLLFQVQESPVMTTMIVMQKFSCFNAMGNGSP